MADKKDWQQRGTFEEASATKDVGSADHGPVAGGYSAPNRQGPGITGVEYSDPQHPADSEWRDDPNNPENLAINHRNDGGPLAQYGALLDNNSNQSRSYEFLNRHGAAEEEARMAEAWAKYVSERKGVQADMGADNQTRGVQMGLVGAYQQAMAGGGPSLVAGQAQRGMDNNVGAAMMAGGNPNAQRAAMLGAGGGAAGIANQAGNARAAEMSGFRDQFTGLAGGMRNADFNRADKQAGLDMRQRDLNDQDMSRYEDKAIAIRGMQQGAQQNRADAIRGAANTATKWAQGHKADHDARRQQIEDNWMKNAETVFRVVGTVSDRRVKTDIDESGSDVRGMMDSLSPKTYKYKPGIGEDDTRRAGIMAQDLEKTDLGKSAIIQMPHGKGIEVRHGMSLALAGMADLNKRLAKVESK